MTRRMQANSYFSNSNVHGREHDEMCDCAWTARCHPVPAEPGVSVVVPRQGVALVVDGVVQDADYIDGMRHQLGSNGPVVVDYTIRVREKPTFFEEGKTYRREWATGKEQTYRVDAVRFEDGNAIAFGRMETDDYGVDWVVRRQCHWDGDYRWEEVK